MGKPFAPGEKHWHGASPTSAPRDPYSALPHERLIPILMRPWLPAWPDPTGVSWRTVGQRNSDPIAIVILRGSATATLLNMLVVPTWHLRYGQPEA